MNQMHLRTAILFHTMLSKRTWQQHQSEKYMTVAGVSPLNNCLVVGPPFLIDMCTLLLRFCTHKFALTTDIEKAFLHV